MEPRTYGTSLLQIVEPVTPQLLWQDVDMTESVSAQRTTPDFATLVAAVSEVHRALAEQAAGAVNVSLTLRNWPIGAYIRNCEQQGADRAQYGEALIDRLSHALAATGAVSSLRASIGMRCTLRIDNDHRNRP